MKKGESWCLKDATNDALLQREQLHLSIAEENAAIAQEKIRSITGKGSGATQGEAVKAAGKDLNSQGTKILSKMNEIDQRIPGEDGEYDKDTNHGLNKDAQKSWNEGFKKKLLDAWGR